MSALPKLTRVIVGVYLCKYLAHISSQLPAQKMLGKFGDVADPPNMIAATVRLQISGFHFTQLRFFCTALRAVPTIGKCLA